MLCLRPFAQMPASVPGEPDSATTYRQSATRFSAARSIGVFGRFALINGRFCPILTYLNSKQFLAALRRLGRQRGVIVRQDKRCGKGSHTLLFFGDRMTTLPARRGDIGKGLLKNICGQLGITRDDLN